MAQIINGKEIGEKIRKEIAEKVKELKEKGVTPGLAVILVGDDPASQTYVRNKHRSCEAIGIYSEVIKLPESTTEEELLGKSIN